MKKYTLDIEQAVALGLAQPYAYITRLSEVTVGPTPPDFSPEELLEARFFGPDREVRIWAGETGLEAICLEDDGQDDFLDLPNREIRSARFGKELTLRRYLDYDKDGQAYICATRLVDWKGDAK